MPRSVTPPADGAECGFADRIKIAPQESRRRSRLGSSTAVASLARHGICAGALAPRTPRHMPRSRLVGTSHGFAGDRPSAAPSGTAPKVAFAPLMPAAAADPSRRLKLLAGRARPRGCGGAAAPKCWIKDAPSSPRSSSVRRVCCKEGSTSTVVATQKGVGPSI